jgi:hypothetical protein
MPRPGQTGARYRNFAATGTTVIAANLTVKESTTATIFQNHGAEIFI